MVNINDQETGSSIHSITCSGHEVNQEKVQTLLVDSIYEIILHCSVRSVALFS